MNTAKNENKGFLLLTIGRELRTLGEVQNDIRSVEQSDNFIPQITPYLPKKYVTWQAARNTPDFQQNRQNKYAH